MTPTSRSSIVQGQFVCSFVTNTTVPSVAATRFHLSSAKTNHNTFTSRARHDKNTEQSLVYFELYLPATTSDG